MNHKLIAASLLIYREQYIVHHPVTHAHKPDKVRRVYNFSGSFQGQSLNDRIYNGPDLLNPLTGVLTRFRTWNICLTADVSDMFLQMQVKTENEDSLSTSGWLCFKLSHLIQSKGRLGRARWQALLKILKNANFLLSLPPRGKYLHKQ